MKGDDDGGEKEKPRENPNLDLENRSTLNSLRNRSRCHPDLKFGSKFNHNPRIKN